MSTELLLIDLSAIAHQIYHVSGNEPDPSFISTQILARVRALAANHPHAAICCDSGKSFRHELEPTYKANRDTENRAVLHHQMAVACDTLKAEGFPIWASRGYEADDIIATATTDALKLDDDCTVLIATSDKDLLQLVNGRVSIKKTTDGTTMDDLAVMDKFGVRPNQMLDYLCLVGDSSDNVKGATGIGGVKAGALLKAHDSLAKVYEAIDKGVVNGITPSMRTSLQEFRERWPLVKQLIALKTDAPIPIAEIAVERTAPPIDELQSAGVLTSAPAVPVPSAPNGGDSGISPLVQRDMTASEAIDALGAAAKKVSERLEPKQELVPMPVRDWSQELEPRTMEDAIRLSQRMFDSRLFGAYGTPQAVLATILAGRELGLPAMASLRAFHIIEGKPQLSAATIASLVLQSGKARYFRCVERSHERATYATQRGDDPEVTLTYTIEDGKTAWAKDDFAWKKSGWNRNPADMLVARASSKLARLVYPDVVSGLYAPEEMD